MVSHKIPLLARVSRRQPFDRLRARGQRSEDTRLRQGYGVARRTEDSRQQELRGRRSEIRGQLRDYTVGAAFSRDLN